MIKTIIKLFDRKFKISLLTTTLLLGLLFLLASFFKVIGIMIGFLFIIVTSFLAYDVYFKKREAKETSYVSLDEVIGYAEKKN